MLLLTERISRSLLNPDSLLGVSVKRIPVDCVNCSTSVAVVNLTAKESMMIWLMDCIYGPM